MRARLKRGVRLMMAAVVLAGLAFAPPAGGKPRPSPAAVAAPGLAALGRQYLDAGLPLPPADASLTVAPSGSVRQLPSGGHNDLYALGFQTEAPPVVSNGSYGTLLMGAREIESRDTGADGGSAARRLAAGDGLPAGVLWVRNEDFYDAVFPVNQWLLLAVQCHLRGHERAGRDILTRGLAHEEGTVDRLTPLGDGSLRDALAASAWNHWMKLQAKPDTDRRAVLDHLEKLAAEFPALNGEFQRGYLESLRLALAPERAKTDEVEGFVDALVDHCYNPYSEPTDADDENYVELLRRGFESVPALLAHLDDRRLTRSVEVTGAGPNRPRCVGGLACELLGSIAGGPATNEELASLRSGKQPPDRERVARWWAGASAEGEEVYMTTRVFPPSEVSLQILSARYPRRLAEVYARCLAEPSGDSSIPVAQAICECPGLPREERCRLLRAGADSPRLDRCIEALLVLRDFDRPAADAALVACLDRWPAEASSPYGLAPPEPQISQFLPDSDSAEVWQAYERALLRASVGLRVQMLDGLGQQHGDGSPLVRQLALLDLFLDDPEVRVVRPEDLKPGGRYEGQPIAAGERRQRVGDHVAGLIDKLLEVKPPAGAVHDERWHARHRAAAREAIEQHAREVLQAPMAVP